MKGVRTIGWDAGVWKKYYESRLLNAILSGLLPNQRMAIVSSSRCRCATVMCIHSHSTSLTTSDDPQFVSNGAVTHKV